MDYLIWSLLLERIDVSLYQGEEREKTRRESIRGVKEVQWSIDRGNYLLKLASTHKQQQENFQK